MCGFTDLVAYIYPVFVSFVIYLFPTLGAFLLAPNCYLTSSNYLQVLLLIYLLSRSIRSTEAKPSWVQHHAVSRVRSLTTAP